MGLFTDLILVDFLSIFIALLAVIYAYYKWSFQYWKRRNVPYLQPSIPFGNFLNPWNKQLSIGEDICNMYRAARSKGYKHCGIYNMARADYLLMDLEVAKNVMTKDFNNFVDRGLYFNEKVDPLSAHLFAIGGIKWKKLRAQMSPSFTSGKMKMMFPTVLDYGEVLDKYIEKHVDNRKGAIDVRNILGCFSNDIIASVAFGLDCNSFKEPNSPFREYGKKFFLQNSFLALRTMFNSSFPSVARALGFREIRKDVTDFFIKIVRDAVAYREKHSYTRNDFLQLLIDYRNKSKAQENGQKGDGSTLTIDELAAQCFVFWLAGFETSSATMTYAIYEMALQRDIQQKVRDEINTVLAKHNNQITYESLNDLKYMDQVIDETLRKYPAVPFLTRQAAEDYKIPGSDVVLEGGTRVFISVMGIHYDEEYYKNPERFDPERFSDDNRKNIHPYAHLPFGAGPRLCIGKRFGIMQTKVGLITMLRRCQLTLNERTMVPLKIDPMSLVPLPLGGVWLNVKKL